jgi:hypothetical protein
VIVAPVLKTIAVEVKNSAEGAKAAFSTASPNPTCPRSGTDRAYKRAPEAVSTRATWNGRHPRFE